MAGPVSIRNPRREQHAFQRRIVLAVSLVAVAAVVLAGRLFLLQVLLHDYYLQLSQGNRARLEPIPANRGLILDRNGKVLAENQAAYQLELIREQVPDLAATLRGLAHLQLIPADEDGTGDGLAHEQGAA